MGTALACVAGAEASDATLDATPERATWASTVIAIDPSTGTELTAWLGCTPLTGRSATQNQLTVGDFKPTHLRHTRLIVSTPRALHRHTHSTVLPVACGRRVGAELDSIRVVVDAIELRA
ncbi:hypothetical protein BC830DRAFT_1221268 [Chytriomyces sp. MP71]|nr:hypothetical protein BC830DRAFT_1221268 [Chytriomyces sp. MP71]